jgi:hypothetical protein
VVAQTSQLEKNEYLCAYSAGVTVENGGFFSVDHVPHAHYLVTACACRNRVTTSQLRFQTDAQSCPSWRTRPRPPTPLTEDVPSPSFLSRNLCPGIHSGSISVCQSVDYGRFVLAVVSSAIIFRLAVVFVLFASATSFETTTENKTIQKAAAATKHCFFRLRLRLLSTPFFCVFRLTFLVFPV